MINWIFTTETTEITEAEKYFISPRSLCPLWLIAYLSWKFVLIRGKKLLAGLAVNL